MKKHWRKLKWFLFIGILLSAMGLVGCQHGGDSGERAAHVAQKISRKLDLNNSQQADLNQLAATFAALGKTLGDTRLAMKTATIEQIASGQSNAETLKSMASENQIIIDAALRNAADQLAAWQQTLTPEQNQKALEFLEDVSHWGPPKEGPGHHLGFWRNHTERKWDYLVDHLDLTDEQQSQLKPLQNVWTNRTTTLQTVRSELSSQIQTQLRAGKADADQLYAVYQQHRQECLDLINQAADTVPILIRVLTQAQREKLASFMQKTQGRHHHSMDLG